MKAKYALIIFVVGLCLDAIGWLLRIMHWKYGNEIFALALVIKLIGGLIFLYKIITYPKIKEFLNR